MSFDGQPVFPSELRTMCDTIAHRGPDDDGFYLSHGVGLGMRRLAIIDLSTGTQPVHNEDRTVWVVFNGEIYNYRELRQRLLTRGHRFYTETDTEVIVHLYEERGALCVEDLRGMFAFAVWDENRRRLLIARDRLGVKPLYYAEIGGRLLFASEIKSLLTLPEVPRDLNWESVGHLFTFLSTPPRESILSGVHKLEPGHVLLASRQEGLRTDRYWQLHFQPDRQRSEGESIDELRGLLEESVRLRMVSDVPVGAFLSGGIDSSAVVATMARLSDAPVRTFSIGFDEQDYDELRYARVVAERFKTQHYEMVLEPDALSVLDEITWYLDEPFGDSSAIPTYFVSKLAAEHVKVVLSGDGGDELFAGYDRYRVFDRERRFDRLPASVRKAMGVLASVLPEGVRGRRWLGHIALSGLGRYLDASTLFRHEQQRKLFRPEVYARFAHYDPWQVLADALPSRPMDWLSTLQYIDFKSYLPLDILTKVDRMSMAHSIEAREPLLDHRLVEFAATLRPDQRLRDQTGKYLFKRALRETLPDAIIDRPKRGFAIPLGRWFRGRLAGFVRDLLLDRGSRAREIVDVKYVEELLRRHERGRDLDLHLWTLISFELWSRRFLGRPETLRGYGRAPGVHDVRTTRPRPAAITSEPSAARNGALLPGGEA
jgi:asparagine synthase (glutamine-hydrolysing)